MPERRVKGICAAAVCLVFCLTGIFPAAAGDPGGVPKDVSATRPHFILISIDTLRADRLGCYGYPKKITPHIDAFAAEGVIFRKAFAPANNTVRSHTSLFTSLQPVAHGAQQDRISVDLPPVLAEVLQAAGFATAAFTQGEPFMSNHEFDRGFDTYVNSSSYGSEDRTSVAGRQNVSIEDHLKEKPPGWETFMFVHYYDVHCDQKGAPYLAPDETVERLCSVVCNEFTGCSEYGCGCESLQKFSQKGDVLGPEKRECISCLYDCGVAYVDSQVGALFEMLKRNGLYENALIVLVSDHGEEFQEDGYFLHMKPRLNDRLIHVPLIVKLPESEKRRPVSVDGMAGLIDVMPTVLEFYGLSAEHEMQGESFLGALRGGDFKGKDFVYALSDEYGSVRSERWKYWLPDTGDPSSAKLYDLREDPEELRDVAAENIGEARSMRERLEAKYEEAGRWFASEGVRVPAEELERLKSLGYVSS